MNIIAFGTSEFAASIFSFLIDQGIHIKAVVTRPDKPRGRSDRPEPSAVKKRFLSSYPHIPMYQPQNASTTECANELKKYDPDLFIVVAYGALIKPILLDLPKEGAINVHPSVLPKYRGASPIQYTLMHGDAEAGVTVIEMSPEMDAGDILIQEKIPLDSEMDFGQLEKKLCDLSCKLLVRVLHAIESHALVPIPQNHALATYCSKITPEKCEIHWKLPAWEIHHLVRALSPKPGAWCFIKIGEEIKRLKIKKSRVVQIQGTPGETLAYTQKEWIIGCGKDALALLVVQLEGKNQMLFSEFVRGYPSPLFLGFARF